MAGSQVRDSSGNPIASPSPSDIGATQSASKATRDGNINRRKSSGTSDTRQRTNSIGKIQGQQMVAGRTTIFHGELKPTKFIPNLSEGVIPDKTPDYYRNGKQRIKTDESGRNTIVWEPMKRRMDDKPVDIYASIRLVDNKEEQTNADGQFNNSIIPEFSKFFLEGVSEAHSEKVQIVESFNDWYAFFYGEKPPVYTFSGKLLNLLNYNWLNEFMYYYEHFWRGTRAAELGAKVFITYNYQQVQGYILGINTNIQALTDKAAPFSIQVLVTKRLIFNGTPVDNTLRDNLLPRSDTGFINTSVSQQPYDLTNKYISKGSKSSNSFEGISDFTRDYSNKLALNNATSAPKTGTGAYQGSTTGKANNIKVNSSELLS